MASFDVVAELFEIATHNRQWGASPPTDRSIDRINKSLGVRVPHLYHQIASACPNYGAYLNGIGEDFDHGVHILRLNKVFHDLDEAPLPRHFVMITHGEDGEAFCWDTRERTRCDEHPIVHIGLEPAWGDTPARVRIDALRFENFHAFLEDIAVHYGQQSCPGVEPRLVARASELIQEIMKGRKDDP